MHLRYYRPRVLPKLFNVNRIMSLSKYTTNETYGNTGNTYGNNGQVQIWQFFLRTLMSVDHQDIIRWVIDEYYEEGVFRIVDKYAVALLWREAKSTRAPFNPGYDQSNKFQIKFAL